MSDTEQEPPKSATEPPNDPPKDLPKDLNGIATTQTSLISPLQDPVALAERKAARKLLAQTAIGIAPPALGSKAPPPSSRASNRPPVSLPSGSRPPPAVPSDRSGPSEKPAPSLGSRPPASMSAPAVGSRPPPSQRPPESRPPASRPPAPMSSAPASSASHSSVRSDRSELSEKPAPSLGSKPPIAPSAPKVPYFDEPELIPSSIPNTTPYADTMLAGEPFKPPPEAARSEPSTSEAPKPRELGIRDTARSVPHQPIARSAPPPLGSTLIGTAPPMPPMPSGDAVKIDTKADSSKKSDPPKPVMTPLPSGPSKIVPRRRTPAKGMIAAAPIAEVPSKEQSPKITPAAGSPPEATPVRAPSKPSFAPPVIRIPGAGAIRTKQDGTLLCEILLRLGSVTQEKIDEALGVQEERGGQIGRILVQLGACGEDAIARALIEQLKTRKDGGYLLSDVSLAAREKKEVAGLKVLTRPTLTVAVLLLTDLFSLLLAALVATAVHWFRTYSELQAIDWTSWLVVGPGIALCMISYLGLELYSPLAKSTPDEIRDITFASSLVHFGASVLSTLGDLPIVKWGVFVRIVWWVATLFLVPIIRSTVRNIFSVQPWWGIPVVVLGAAKTGRLVVRTLRAQPRSGLKPVVLLDDDKSKLGTLRASFTNEVMDIYSVNVASAHFLTEEQRAAFSQDIFGDDYERGAPISSDHIPIAAPINSIDLQNAPTQTGPQQPPSEKMALSRRSAQNQEFFTPESSRLSSRSVITKDASQFPRGKFAEVDGVPLVGDLSLAPILAQRLKIPYAVVAMPGLDSPKLLQIIERIGGQFTHLLIIPDLFGFASMGVPAKSLGGILGVEVRQQLLLPGPRLAKRIIDTALTGFGALFVLPFLVLIALLIKLDSKGPIFYWQNRLGKDGSYFKAYKFRTMHGDGEARLKAILEADPALKAEYEIYHKLRKDPRVTRIGRFLRKFSLDEFPQLWNVINGDMSLVGPRPYIERELTEMGGQEKIILRAPPGMTGMWQVSDRNATSFAQRCQIDVYYVRNWSPWLDIHILAKTFGVVLKGSGV